MSFESEILSRLAALERRTDRSVQTPTYWARTTEEIAGTDDPEIGVESEVEPLINDRSAGDDSHKTGRFSGGTQTVFHRGVSSIPAQTTVLVEVTSLGHAIVDGGGGGSGGSGDGCCCCESVEFPDTILTDGIKTTSQRVLCSQIGVIKYRYDWGTLTITLPEPGNMILEREDEDPPTDNFVWEMDETVFSATYSDGTDATDDLVEPSGTVLFNHTLPVGEYGCGCPQMRLRIEWDVDEPIPPAGSGA